MQDRDVPFSMAYLIVGKAATIRYISVIILHYIKWAYSRVGDVLLLILTILSATPSKEQKDIRNVKVDSNEDLLALEVNVGDG